MNRCPFCGARLIGRIGRERYYCSECCHEWTVEEGHIKIYRILVDGTVDSLKLGSDAVLANAKSRFNRRQAG
ncbi:MAG: hypothetical protein ACYCV0_16685 [Desulfitobacteriaceae bacterium]